jgi:hypothetical protein
MALLLQLLFVLAAFVAVFSCIGCNYVSNRYDSILETKYPDMRQSLSTRRKWPNNPITWLQRWRKAIKLGDDELTKAAKKCCLLIYISFAGTICLILLGAMLHSVL